MKIIFSKFLNLVQRFHKKDPPYITVVDIITFLLFVSFIVYGFVAIMEMLSPILKSTSGNYHYIDLRKVDSLRKEEPFLSFFVSLVDYIAALFAFWFFLGNAIFYSLKGLKLIFSKMTEKLETVKFDLDGDLMCNKSMRELVRLLKEERASISFLSERNKKYKKGLAQYERTRSRINGGNCGKFITHVNAESARLRNNLAVNTRNIKKSSINIKKYKKSISMLYVEARGKQSQKKVEA